MSYQLFLDDVRMPYQVGDYMYPVELRRQYRLEEWKIVRNYQEFVAAINELGLPSKISFDHDLADVHYDPATWTESFVYQEETGYDCAKWLCDYCMERGLPLPEYYVHSMNPIGKENIIKYLTNYKNRK